MNRPAPLENRQPNPFDTPEARAGGVCVAWREDRLERVPDPGEPVPPFAEFVHDSFRALVLNRRFSCLGAKAAVHAGTYRLGVYDTMSSTASTAALARDLLDFDRARQEHEAPFATFVATFTGPLTTSEREFEASLWAQLRALHELDRAHHEWDASVSADPDDPTFSFSFAQSAFFVVGLHPASSRWSRRFTWPTLVFNPHVQFKRLREEGKFKVFREAIRQRELELQGTLNPNLTDHGEASDARQYSGRAVEPEWRCPFPHAKEPDE